MGDNAIKRSRNANDLYANIEPNSPKAKGCCKIAIEPGEVKGGTEVNLQGSYYMIDSNGQGLGIESAFPYPDDPALLPEPNWTGLSKRNPASSSEDVGMIIGMMNTVAPLGLPAGFDNNVWAGIIGDGATLSQARSSLHVDSNNGDAFSIFFSEVYQNNANAITVVGAETHTGNGEAQAELKASTDGVATGSATAIVRAVNDSTGVVTGDMQVQLKAEDTTGTLAGNLVVQMLLQPFGANALAFALTESGIFIGDTVGGTQWGLPLVRGTENQILQIDNLGAMNFVDYPTYSQGTDGVGATSVTYGDGRNFVTEITISQNDALNLGDNVDLGDGHLVFTFPAGAIVVEEVWASIAVTAGSADLQADTPAWGFGTTQASGAISTLTGAEENIFNPGVVKTDCNGTVDAQFGTSVTSLRIESVDDHTVYFNVANTWSDETGGDVTADLAGTVTIKWTLMS